MRNACHTRLLNNNIGNSYTITFREIARLLIGKVNHFFNYSYRPANYTDCYKIQSFASGYPVMQLDILCHCITGHIKLIGSASGHPVV